MDILRRNTDYALRMAVNLARNSNEGPRSTRAVSGEEDVPYQLACKLMQRLVQDGEIVLEAKTPELPLLESLLDV